MELDKIHNTECMAFMRGMEDNSVDCVLTDLPYNEMGRRENGGFDHARHIVGGACDDATGFDLDAALREMWRVCRGSFYVFCGFGQISQIHEFFLSMGVTTRMIVWEKTNPLPMNGESTWLFGIEPCMFAKKKGATFNLRFKNTVLRYPIATKTGHPTPKNVELFGQLVLASTNEGDVVFDPFCGAATTAVACIRTNRHYVCVERDKEYYRLGVERVHKLEREPCLF